MSAQSLTIQASIIHQIIKESNHTNRVPPLIRDKLHTDITQVKKLIDFLDMQLEKNGLAHSHVKTFNNPNTLSHIVREYLLDELCLRYLKYSIPNSLSFSNIMKSSFQLKARNPVPAEANEDTAVLSSETLEQTRYRRITNHLAKGLHYHIYEERMTTGDHVPMIFYTDNGVQYLYIALLSLTDAITINENTGEILDTNHIDASALKVACKINITQIEEHRHLELVENFKAKNYVAWIQKGTSNKIAEYIQNFLPVMFRIDDKSATTKLMKALIQYLDESDFDENAKKDIRCDALTILRLKAKSKTNINIAEDIDPIISIKSNLVNLNIAEEDSFKSFREKYGYGADNDNNSNIFAPADGPLNNFEIFSFTVGDDDFLKISGKQILIGDKINLKDDIAGATIEVKLSPEELVKIKPLFNLANQNESTSNTDTDTDTD